MASNTFVAENSEQPVLWVPKQSGAYTVKVSEGVRVVRSRSVENAVVGAFVQFPFVLVLVIIFLITILPGIENTQSTSSDSTDWGEGEESGTLMGLGFI